MKIDISFSVCRETWRRTIHRMQNAHGTVQGLAVPTSLRKVTGMPPVRHVPGLYCTTVPPGRLPLGFCISVHSK